MIGKTHKSCKTLTLERFLACLYDNSLKSLVIWGYFMPSRLERVWDDIWNEYQKISSDSTQQAIIRLMKEATQLGIRYYLICDVVRCLRMRYSKELHETLTVLGYREKLDPINQSQYQKKLSIIESKAKLLKTQKEEKEKDLKNYQKSKSKETNWDEILSELSKFQGYRLDKTKITVSEFCAVSKRYREHAKMMEKKKK